MVLTGNSSDIDRVLVVSLRHEQEAPILMAHGKGRNQEEQNVSQSF